MNFVGLEELRNDINKLDNDILELFVQRMNVCHNVALFKQENNLPVFQAGREDEVIKRIRQKAPQELEKSTEVLFETIMDISKCKQQQEIFKEKSNIDFCEFPPTNEVKIGCQGTMGAYSHIAANKIFGDVPVSFLGKFEDVFKAVEDGTIDFGILPIQNSTAGSVSLTYELMKKYNFYISAGISVKVEHCLAIKKGTDFSRVTSVYSHEQALAQCSDYLSANNLKPVEYANTALAGEFVAESSEPIAAICSAECAERCGLEIISDNIANASENYTRFICISKNIYISKDADIISVSLALPHTPGALYRLLTKFAVIGLNLLRIESKPIASKDFDVVFYLDFAGSIRQPEVLQIIAALKSELTYFKFLGNYNEVT